MTKRGRFFAAILRSFGERNGKKRTPCFVDESREGNFLDAGSIPAVSTKKKTTKKGKKMQVEEYEELILRTQNQVNSLAAMLENATVSEEDFWNFLASTERSLEKNPPDNLRYYFMVLECLETCRKALKAVKSNPEPSSALFNLRIIEKSMDKMLDLIEIE